MVAANLLGMTPRARRALEAFLFVAVWIFLGLALKLDPNAYLIAGIPLTIVFQMYVRRVPLRAAWVCAAPPVKVDIWTIFFAMALAAMPMVFLVQAIQARDYTACAWTVAALGGAVAGAYALRSFEKRALRPLLLCLATIAAIAVFFFGGAAFVAVATHHRAAPEPARAAIEMVRWFLLYLPVCFALEEVTFRGVLDAHVHGDGEKSGWLSAIFVSMLWGVWHFPTVPPQAGGFSIAGTVLWLVVFHTILGVPLTIYYRRGGNLWVPALSHALADGVRNALLGGH